MSFTEPAHMQHESVPDNSTLIPVHADSIGCPSGGAGEEANDGRLEAPTQAAPNPRSQGQVVLILCGLVASGKSTFAEQLAKHFPEFTRCNQDDLGDRRRVEQLSRQMLASGRSVCIDRANFDASQRFHWIKIAREFPGTQIWVIVFDTPYEVCAARLKERTGHPTITDIQQGLSVLSRFASAFQHPRDHEGHDRIIYLKPSDHTSPEYTRADISDILDRLRESSPVQRPQQSGSGNFAPSPGSLDNGRGRGRGRGYPYFQQRGGAWRGGGPSSMGREHTSTNGRAWQRGRGLPPGGWRDRRGPFGGSTDVQ